MGFSKTDYPSLEHIITEGTRPAIIMYGAYWSEASRIAAEALKELEAQRTDIVFGYVDIDAFPQHIKEEGIFAIPYFRLIKHGSILGHTLGFTTISQLVHELGVSNPRAVQALRDPADASSVTWRDHDHHSHGRLDFTARKGDHDIGAFQLLSDEAFHELYLTSLEQAITPADLEKFAMPDGVTKDQAWRILWLLRRKGAVFGPDLYYHKGKFVHQWESLTTKVLTSLRDIKRRAVSGSFLDQVFEERIGESFVTDALIEDIAFSLRADGFAINAHEVEAITRKQQVPTTAAQHVALAMYRLVTEPDPANRKAHTVDSLSEILSRLLQDISESETPPRRVPLPYRPEYHGLTPDNALEIICAALDESVTAPNHPVLINAFNILCRFVQYQPLGHCNCSVGNIVVRKYLVEKGYTAFRFLPLFSIVEKWRIGYYDEREAAIPYLNTGILFDGERDWTNYFETLLLLLDDQIKDIESQLKRVDSADEALISAIRSDESLNARQREVLVRAILSPTTEFHPGSHQAEHHVSYATSYRDLVGLAQRGYLRASKSGKKVVFRAADDLTHLLSRHYL